MIYSEIQFIDKLLSVFFRNVISSTYKKLCIFGCVGYDDVELLLNRYTPMN